MLFPTLCVDGFFQNPDQAVSIAKQCPMNRTSYRPGTRSACLSTVNIDFYNPEIFMQEIGKLDKDKSYYIYCRTGVRSANSCHLMKELGFTKTYNFV